MWDRGHPRQPGDNAGSIARQTVCKWRSHRERKFFVLNARRHACQRRREHAVYQCAGDDYDVLAAERCVGTRQHVAVVSTRATESTVKPDRSMSLKLAAAICLAYRMAN